MPDIGGMSPEFRAQTHNEIDRIGKENGTQEAHEERQPEPVSIFNALDTDQNKSVNLAEAKSKVMQGMQAGSNNGVLNVSNGSFSFKSLFETAMQKFNNISYEATEQGAAGVDAQIDSQVTSFNQSAEQLYNQYLEQRTNEAKSTSQIEDGKLVYRDAAGQIFETLDLSTAELAKYGYDENGNLLSADHMNTNGETVYETDYTYNDKNQLTSQTVTTNGNTATTSYQYNDAGQVTKESTVDTNGGTYEVNTNYDKKGRRTSEEISMSFGGTRTTLTTNYDKKGRIRETENTTTDATGTSTKTETYRKDGSRSTVRENASITDANTGTTTTTSFSTDYRRNGTVDEKSETRTETNTDGSSISSTISTDYRRNGNKGEETSSVTITNPDGSKSSSTTVTDFRRNGSVDDETKTVVLPDGSSTTSETEYYRNGNTKNFSSTSSNGFEGEISYRRDGSMKRMELENPNGSTSDTRYRNDGSVERHEIKDANGATVDTRFNEDGSTVAYKYNARGELKTTTTTTALPDGGKQVVTETPEGATVTDIFDKDGKQVSQKIVSPNGYVTTKTFGGEEEAPVTSQGENLLTPSQGTETSIVLTQPSYLNGLMADNNGESILIPLEGAKPPVTNQPPVEFTETEGSTPVNSSNTVAETSLQSEGITQEQIQEYMQTDPACIRLQTEIDNLSRQMSEIENQYGFERGDLGGSISASMETNYSRLSLSFEMLQNMQNDLKETIANWKDTPEGADTSRNFMEINSLRFTNVKKETLPDGTKVYNTDQGYINLLYKKMTPEELAQHGLNK